MSLDFEKIHTPKTLSHEFELQPLADTLAAKPLSAAACKLIDMPKNEFLDTEEEINVIEAALYILSVKFDTLPQEERPNDRDKVRLWITRNRGPVMEQLISRVEPPFHAQSIDLMYKDAAAMMDERLVKVLPKDAREAKTQR
ncbi:hypothetical protein I350_07368 [Cryptococcus amylolentus CBS 6273]|uniref:Uncharacterized protein n=1 Tax=Cryptococcus amylolentus CBS 6273 TaxID=1296118 RepID=A0A1E3JEB6_9TREE|nr:hypothetical protein I350_07368 [Cryptococcus amylolentus CBS 6273]